MAERTEWINHLSYPKNLGILPISTSGPSVQIKEAFVQGWSRTVLSFALFVAGPRDSLRLSFPCLPPKPVLSQVLSNGPVATLNSHWLLTFRFYFYFWNCCCFPPYQIAGLTAFLTLLAAVSILQNIPSVNSIQSKVVTMFGIVLTQPMALEEI